MYSRRSWTRLAVFAGCILLLVAISLELLRRSNSISEQEMLYPQIISGVWVNGFEESSFFRNDTSIPDRHDPRRYREELDANREHLYESPERYAKTGYAAFHVTFLGRRSKYPYFIDCEGRRYHFYISDWMLRERYLGPMPNPDRLIPGTRGNKPFKRSGEGGVIRRLEDEALARCGGT